MRMPSVRSDLIGIIFLSIIGYSGSKSALIYADFHTFSNKQILSSRIHFSVNRIAFMPEKRNNKNEN